MRRPTDPLRPARPPRRLLLVVLAGHLLLLWALLSATGRAWRSAVPEAAVLQWVRIAPTPATPPAEPLPRTAAPPMLPPRAPDALPRARSTPEAPMPTAPNPDPAGSTLAVLPAEPAASAVPPERPRERLLDSAASRAALRQSAHSPLLAERAAQASDIPLTRSDQALSAGVDQAKLGDCLKGEHAGGGMGLLGLPLLAYAAATGRCAR